MFKFGDRFIFRITRPTYSTPIKIKTEGRVSYTSNKYRLLWTKLTEVLHVPSIGGEFRS